MDTGAWLIVSRDSFFIKKIQLLCERHHLIACTDVSLVSVPIRGCIHDTDTAEHALIPSGVQPVLRFSRHGGTDTYPIPTPLDLLEQLLRGEDPGLTLSEKERTVSLGSRKIALTEMEYALLRRLIAAEGKAVTQEELLCDVWNGEAGAGTVTVYVHYLRRKLESGGERVLRIKRGQGYYIDEKYAKGAILC